MAPVQRSPLAVEPVRPTGAPNESRVPGRPATVAQPAVNVAPPVRAFQPPHGVEAQRPAAPPRNVEAPRAVEAPRHVAPPPRLPEPPRAVAPVAVPAAPKAVEPVRPEPARTAPEQHVGKPEVPRHEDKRDEKRDPNDKQR